MARAKTHYVNNKDLYEAMIKFKTKIKDFSIPTNWNDVIFKDYLRLQNSNSLMVSGAQ